AWDALVGWASYSITKLEMSTMLLMERMATLSLLARSHCGLGPIVTLSILRAEKKGHSRVEVIVTPVFLTGIFDSRAVDLIFFPVSAAISRARPKWLRRSPRFGVISTSRMVSVRKRSAMGAPTFASGDKIKRPEASSP